MLQEIITNFLDYCKHYQFSKSTIEAFTTRLNELDVFLKDHHIQSIQEVTYQNLIEFVTWNTPSTHIKKVRVWTMHQFFHYLKFHRLIEDNIAQKLPYPQIEKKEPQFLTLNELKSLLCYFLLHANTLPDMRNLIIIMMFSFLGLRLKALIKLNIEDVCLNDGLLWVKEKGYVKRLLPMPQILCIKLYQYLKQMDRKSGPLFLSKRKRRVSERAVQYIFDKAENDLSFDKHLHCHLFRHTAATQINQTAGVDITQSVLGHRSRRTTERYIHLDSITYAEHMRQHPYHDLREVAHA